MDPARYHHDWDNGLAPALRVASGDVVHFDLLMAGHGQVHEGARFEDCTFDLTTLYNLGGPVFVEGARPGDTLRVEILALETGDWGWTSILPGLGLLPEDFPDPALRTWDLCDNRTIQVTDTIRIPQIPFLGSMGVALDDPPRHDPFPPHKGGGNLDTRHLTVGASLYLPVWCEGALFSCGDAHAAQGDGEVCVSAVECDMRASLRLTVQGRTIPAPHFTTTGPLLAGVDESRGHFGAMGIAPDLMEGARSAVRATIDWLGTEHGVDPVDAYFLCSLAGDLKILEVVDAGMWNVGFTLPLSVLPS